jgi:hypothetical protein
MTLIKSSTRPAPKAAGRWTTHRSRALAFDTLNLSQPEARLDSTDDGERYFVLERENIVRFAVITFSPNVRSRHGIDELSSNTHAIRYPAHAAFEHIAHAKFAADLFHIDRSGPYM